MIQVQHVLSRPGGIEQYLNKAEAAAVRRVLPEQVPTPPLT